MRLEQDGAHSLGTTDTQSFDALCNSMADFIRPPVTISKAFKLVFLIALKDRKIGNEVKSGTLED